MPCISKTTIIWMTVFRFSINHLFPNSRENFRKIPFEGKDRTSGNALFILRCPIEGNLSAQGATSIFPFILATAHPLFYPACNTFSPPSPPSNRRRLPAFISPQPSHSYIPESLFISCLWTPRRSDSYIVSYSSVSARADGKTAQWKRMIWSGGERSTLIKVASSFSLSRFCSTRGRILAIFPEKNANRTYLSPLDSPPEHLRSRGVIWKLYNFAIPLLRERRSRLNGK